MNDDDVEPTAIPEELALAAHVELGIASLADVQGFVDGRLLVTERPGGSLLALCDLRTEDRVEIARRLEDLSAIPSDETRAAWLAVAAVRACESGLASLERVTAFLERIAERLGELSHVARGIDDVHALAVAGTYGTLEDVHEALRALEHDLLAAMRVRR